MTPQLQPSQQQTTATQNERILVVQRNAFFAHHPAWHGLKKSELESYLSLARTHQEFIWRKDAELDPTYKQIIPYLIFEHNNHYFVMERSAQASEQRLKSKLTLGIGGHIRQEDITGATLFDWARREFHEEVDYAGSFSIEPLGIINDDSNAVGQVHVGFALLLKGDSDAITVKSELKSGMLMTREEIALQYDRFESWSQFIIDAL